MNTTKSCYYCNKEINESDEYTKFCPNWSVVEMYDCGCRFKKNREKAKQAFEKQLEEEEEFRELYNATESDNGLSQHDYIQNVEYLIDFIKHGCNCCGSSYYVVCKMKDGTNQAYDLDNFNAHSPDLATKLGPLFNHKKFVETYTDFC